MSPGMDEQKRSKDKSPLEFCAILVREVWRLFEAVWENRNDCLHSPTRHWIKHSEHVIRRWSYKKKRQLLRVLDGWHSKHKTETIAAAKNQKSLREFAGFTVLHPPERGRNTSKSGTS